MNRCTQDQKAITRKAERAIRAYTAKACIIAYRANRWNGYGAAGILHGVDCDFPFKTVGQVDAAINAGAWLVSIGHGSIEQAVALDAERGQQ